MTLFARYGATYKSHKWSSNVWDGDCRDGEKMLCNRCPLKHEVQERGRSEMIYENTFEPNTTVEIPERKNITDIFDT